MKNDVSCILNLNPQTLLVLIKIIVLILYSLTMHIILRPEYNVGKVRDRNLLTFSKFDY